MEKKIFITYSWDDNQHKEWVRNLADKLIKNGIDILLDQYDLEPGESFTHFMEKSIEETDKVLVILTPNYRVKSLNRYGGVGYEQQIISGEIMQGVDRKKFIPLLVKGSYDNGDDCAIPTHFKGIVTLDFRKVEDFDSAFEILLRAIYQKPKFEKPEKGMNPFVLDSTIPIFKIELNENFETVQDDIILTDIYTQISDLRKSNKPYKIEFRVSDIFEIREKYLELSSRNDLSVEETQMKINYREWLNSNFYWDTSNIYEKLQEAMENIIDLSYVKFQYLSNAYDLSRCINNCFKLFNNKIYSHPGKGFDVFNQSKNWSFRIYLNEDEIQKLLSVFGITDKFKFEHSQLLSAFGGLDVFDLYSETLKFQAIPKQAVTFAYEKFLNRLSEEDRNEFFNIGTWKIGLA